MDDLGSSISGDPKPTVRADTITSAPRSLECMWRACFEMLLIYSSLSPEK